jgi:phage-related protein (TIGR01555 family)
MTVSSTEKKGVETEVQDNVTDLGLIQYQFYRDAMDNAENRGQTLFFDSTDSMPISTTTYGQQEINRGLMVKNTRWITFNIPAIDALSRSNPLVKKAVNYLSSKPLINGIDINSSELDSDEIYQVSKVFKNLYASLRQWLSKGINYGGSGGILWFKGDDNRNLEEPLVISKVKKGSFMGIKPLARWFQIEPDLSSALIQDVDPQKGIYDARMIGMPEYYNVSLDGGLVGQGKRKQYRVHVSRLIIFNAEMPSFIETQIERYWGASIIELAWNDLNIDHRLWRATAKTLDKNNMGIYKIDGLGLAGSTMSASQRNKYQLRMSLMKESSTQNVIVTDAKDDFSFASAVLSGYSDILNIDHSRLAGSFRVPLSVLFPGEKSDDEDRLYLQSLSELTDIQELYLRPALNVVLPVIIKSEVGKSVKDLNYTFNPIETQTLKDKAEMFKIMAEGLETLKRIGAIDTASAIKMVDDINKNPLNISQNINKKYREQILTEAEQGIFHTDISDKIDLAKALNQFNQDGGSDEGDGDNGKKRLTGKQKAFAGSQNLQSEVRVSEGGNPKNQQRPMQRHTLNEDKGKK